MSTRCEKFADVVARAQRSLPTGSKVYLNKLATKVSHLLTNWLNKPDKQFDPYANLDTHPIIWKMPRTSALYSTFQPALARAIASSEWRNHHKTCFCDLALHHIQELLAPVDIATACPDDGYS